MPTPTLRELFVSTNNGTLDAGLRLPPPEGLAELAAGFEWAGVGERVLDLLDINVVDVLIGGWRSHQDVRRELRLTADNPSRKAMVHLAHHSIQSTHTPSVEVRAQGRTLAEMSFPLELTFEIEAVGLTLHGGAIREIRPGEVKVRGTLKLENSVLLEREHAPIALPGTISLAAPSTAGQPAAPSDRR